MTQTPYELLARLNADGTVAGVSIRYLFTVGNKTIEGDPEPLQNGANDPAFTGFAQQFAAAIVVERDSLLQEKSIFVSQVADLEQQKATAISNLELANAEVAAKQANIEQLESDLAAANLRITALLDQVQFDPRIIEANAFLNRIASTELAQLFSSVDPNVQAISQMLLAYKANDWRIELDSVEMQQAVGYLQQIGMVTQERATALLRDGTRAEAYIDDGSV